MREVDLNDTELALGDDDGWLAVVIANRLPRPDTRYTAYLISIEGQTAASPVPETRTPTRGPRRRPSRAP